MRKEKNNVFLLFKNAFKQALRNKIQLVALTALVLLSSTIFSLMQTSVARINNEYNNLVIASNLHDFVVDLDNTVKRSDANPPQPPSGAPTNFNDQAQLYLAQFGDTVNNTFTWDRVEARTLQLNNDNNPRVLKLIADNQRARIDKLVISKGYGIGANPNEITPGNKQIVINKEFAENNNLAIGDTIRVQQDNIGSSLKVNYDLNDPKYINYNWLKIVGFGTSADFITPIIDQTTPLPNKAREGIIYVDPSQFGLTPTNYQDAHSSDYFTLWTYNRAIEKISVASLRDQEVYFVGKTNTSHKNNLGALSDALRSVYNNTTDQSAKLAYALGDSAYRFNNRTATLPNTINAFTILLILLLLIVLTITGITVVLVTYKNIDNSKPAIGILKSLGYSNWKILITSLAYPMVAALIGTILVFLPASGLQIVVVNTFANYFNLNFGSFILNGLGFLYCLILTFGFLSIIAWIISALTVIKKPIDLINNISTTRDSHFTHFVKKTSAHRNFLTRFRLALFTSSIGKMAAVSLTMFLGTTLMTTAVIGPKIMADNKVVTYTGMNYKSLTEYYMPVWNSPYSFFKTYNPNAQRWGSSTSDDGNYTYTTRTDQTFADALYNNSNNDPTTPSINSEVYAPIGTNAKTDPSALLTLGLKNLTFLYGKMMTKDFLANLDKSNTDASLISILAILAWPEVSPVYSIIGTNSIYNLANYQALRIFYSNYRSTIMMNLNPEITDSSNPNEIVNQKFFDFLNKAAGNDAWKGNPTLKTWFTQNFKFDHSDHKYPWHIQDENQLLYNPNPIDQTMQNDWINNVLLWFYAIFYNRAGEIVAQGTYTKSPYFIKQNIAQAFEDPNKQFNISFNVIPYDKTTDELGTYFLGTPSTNLSTNTPLTFNGNSYPMKVYGIQSQQELGKPSLMQLTDSSGYSLNPLLFDKNTDPNVTNIVINQTIAKQLNLKVGQTFTMNPNGKTMQTNGGSGIDYHDIALNKINYDVNNGPPIPPDENNANILTQQTAFGQIPKLNGATYDYINAGANATNMTQVTNNGAVLLASDQKKQNSFFKVVGVYDGYGQPSAYIAKNNADKLLRFEETKATLYKIYQQEWQNKTDQELIKKFNFNLLKNYANYDDFNKSTDTNVKPLKKIFNNEYPIFNFKFSASDSLPDIQSSFSVSQSFGDYSQLGMNGGTDTGTGITYQGYGQGTAENVLPLVVHKELLNQITQLVDAILISFIIFSLIISFFIILITSDLVIYENRKVIATMKTLGYSDAKITNIVIGMYLPVIVAMFVIAFPVGWVIVNAVINYLAANSTWVLPFFFAWWLPVVVGVIVLGIYATTFLIEWNAMKKIRPLQILNETT